MIFKKINLWWQKNLPVSGQFVKLIKILIPIFFFVTISCNSPNNSQDDQVKMPLVLDERLELTLLAEDPDIMTPIGIAIDSLNRIFVLESHTHSRPQYYEGPEGDVIKIFSGNKKGFSVFAEGFNEGMHMAFSPDGILYLVTSKKVWALYDHNKDGICDEKKLVLELTKPKKVYPHAALLGITFDNEGGMYISRGNTGSQLWKMVGTDGKFLEGYGDGGNIFKARTDGSEIQEFATGFWNPVNLQFDDYGRLLVMDNDPDSRGPNRLLDVIQGGNYGYKSLYGGSGIHPYLAWNGELPGT
jgi:putative membrane-bound dehydrogenase-like protein